METSFLAKARKKLTEEAISLKTWVLVFLVLLFALGILDQLYFIMGILGVLGVKGAEKVTQTLKVMEVIKHLEGEYLRDNLKRLNGPSSSSMLSELIKSRKNKAIFWNYLLPLLKKQVRKELEKRKMPEDIISIVEDTLSKIKI